MADHPAVDRRHPLGLLGTIGLDLVGRIGWVRDGHGIGGVDLVRVQSDLARAAGSGNRPVLTGWHHDVPAPRGSGCSWYAALIALAGLPWGLVVSGWWWVSDTAWWALAVWVVMAAFRSDRPAPARAPTRRDREAR